MLTAFPLPDHSQGQTLVEPLALPGFTRHINKLFCKTTQQRGSASGLAMHTSDLNKLPLVESGNCFGDHGIFGI